MKPPNITRMITEDKTFETKLTTGSNKFINSNFKPQFDSHIVTFPKVELTAVTMDIDKQINSTTIDIDKQSSSSVIDTHIEPPSNTEDLYYDEVIIYDGGGVEGYGYD